MLAEPSRSEDMLRVLMIVSRDHGDLATAVNLVRGSPLDVTLLMPGDLLTLHGHAIHWLTNECSSANDVLAAIAKCKPQVVLFCSLYLMPLHRLMQMEDIAPLLDSLRAQGIAVANTDPFLGLAGTASFNR